ncbi:uncharacterized protein LOC126787376 [Argentina anserina]|uniref:uncharacterized protein LOC126787376 n=1 Tax=Argentina anserina TaxID=57926 RepID=UPI0021768466|nr:uncharacterized protein LOC126787376 [Potentilla anserina]
MNVLLGVSLFFPKSDYTEQVVYILIIRAEMEVSMNVFPKVLCGWSWEENKLFELALAVVDEQDPQRWEIVAALVGGKKSAEDVHKHYVVLLEDLKVIESGNLDHKLGGVGEDQGHNYVQVDSSQSLCWTDEINNLLVKVNLN